MSKLIGELAQMEFKERSEVLGPWLKECNLVMLYAPRGIGKTFFSLWLAHSVCTGVPFLKWAPPKKRRVVLFDGEMGYEALKSRLLQIDRSNKASIEGNALKLVSFEDFGTRLPNLSTAQGQKLYNKEAEGFDVIILDNLLSCAEPLDGRDDEVKMWRRIEPWAVTARKNGKTIIFIHHAGKSGAQLGTSVKENVMDTIISLKRPQQSKDVEGFDAEMVFEKSRNFFGGDAAPLYVQMIESHGDTHWMWKPLSEKRSENIKEMSNNGASPFEIAKEVNLPKFKVVKILEHRELFPPYTKGEADEVPF